MSDSDDPFAEPSDDERTVIRPNPGGRRGPVSQQPQMAAPAAAPAASGESEAEITGLNPLAAAAAPLLALSSRIRNRAQHADVSALRENVIREIKQFEQRSLHAGEPAQVVRIARYALCATIDDVVLNTPWGGQSVWAQQSMVGTFHRETHGGERFFDLLARLEQEPANNRDLLELMYLCCSLGFEGRFRIEERGLDRLASVRDGLARLIRSHRGPLETEISPRWRGLQAAHRAISAWAPVWAITVCTGLLLALTFVGFSWALGGDTERLQGRLEALNVDAPVELARRAPPPPPQRLADSTQLEKITKFLEAEIAEGLVTVFEDASAITVRLRGQGLFASGSDQIEQQFLPVVRRVAAATNAEPGAVIVAGHSDNIKPKATSRWQSNLHLSLARAQSVERLIAQNFDDAGRLTAEGRAEREPIASNDTRDGRAKNRRIEVILVK